MRAILVTLLATVAMFTWAQAQTTASTVYQEAKPAVVTIIAQDHNSQPISIGTGFYFTRDLIATNLHVLAGASSLIVLSNGGKDRQTIRRVKGISTNHDLAILVAAEPSNYMLTLAPSSPLVGASVYAIGSPRGQDSTLSSGIVSGLRTSNSTAMIQITAPISPGSSGGPVLDKNGAVLGVATAYLEGGQNLNFAVSSKHLENLHESTRNSSGTTIVTAASTALRTKPKSALSLSALEVVDWTWRKKDPTSGVRRYLPARLNLEFSIKNKSDKNVDSVDIIFLFYNDDKDLLHYIRKTIRVSIPPGLTQRTSIEEEVQFSTKSFSTCGYRILNYTQKE